MIRTLALVIVAAAAALASSEASAQWGNLKGKFVYDGTAPAPQKLSITKDVEVCGLHNLVDESLLVDKDGGIANVLVYCRTSGVKINPEYESKASAEVLLDNKNCRFEPHILPIRLSQTLVIGNADPVGHNSNVQPLGDVPINPLIAAGGKVTHKFTRAQTIPIPVSCNIHPWMKAYVVPRDNPYYAVSGADGAFEIKGLPAGDLEFQAWQEKAGYLAVGDWERGRFTASIPDGGTADLGTIKVPAALMNK